MSNLNIHHRRSIRLEGFDYSQAGAYFITICCYGMKCRFGRVSEGELISQSAGMLSGATARVAPTDAISLNEFGIIAYNEWLKLPERFSNLELDVFQIMPNHMHGIILLNSSHTVLPNERIPGNNIANVGAGFTPALPTPLIPSHKTPPQTLPPTISDIVGAYKSLVANECLKIFKSKNATMGKLWQRNYYEHIIRNEKSYQNIARYIISNPQKWKYDKYYKE